MRIQVSVEVAFHVGHRSVAEPQNGKCARGHVTNRAFHHASHLNCRVERLISSHKCPFAICFAHLPYGRRPLIGCIFRCQLSLPFTLDTCLSQGIKTENAQSRMLPSVSPML